MTPYRVRAVLRAPTVPASTQSLPKGQQAGKALTGGGRIPSLDGFSQWGKAHAAGLSSPGGKATIKPH